MPIWSRPHFDDGDYQTGPDGSNRSEDDRDGSSASPGSIDDRNPNQIRHEDERQGDPDDGKYRLGRLEPRLVAGAGADHVLLAPELPRAVCPNHHGNGLDQSEDQRNDPDMSLVDDIPLRQPAVSSAYRQ